MDLGRYHADLPHPAQLIAVAPALQVATGPGFFVNISAGLTVDKRVGTGLWFWDQGRRGCRSTRSQSVASSP